MVKIEYQNKTSEKKPAIVCFVLLKHSLFGTEILCYSFIPAALGQQLQRQREKIYKNKQKKCSKNKVEREREREKK